MRWLLLCLVSVTLCLGSVRADETVHELQVRLKKAGFYQAEANGRYDGETSAAVTRYQIRNGLPISGEMDAATLKALDIPPPKNFAATEPSPASGAWRRLRNGEMQFLKKLPGDESATLRPPRPTPGRVVASSVATKPNEKPTIDPHAPPPRLAEDVPPRNFPGPELSTASTTEEVYDPERLRDYVAAFVLAGLDPEAGAETEFFAERVDYFGRPNVSREQIRGDLLRYDKRWPQRQFRLAGNLVTARQTNGTVRVTFPLRYELHNGLRSTSGTVRKTIVLRKTNDDELEIVGVTESRE